MQLFVYALIGLTSTQPTDLKDYYFDIEDFDAPKIYKYECTENPEETEFFRFYKSGNELITETYDYSMNLLNTTKEVYDDEGAKLVSYEVQHLKGKLTTSIEQPHTFKWSDKTPYMYSYNYEDHGVEFHCEKIRTFIEIDTLEVFSTPMATAKIRGDYSHLNIDSKESWNVRRYAYYAKGIGCVRYEKLLPNGQQINLDLSAIMEQAEWNQLLAAKQ